MLVVKKKHLKGASPHRSGQFSYRSARHQYKTSSSQVMSALMILLICFALTFDGDSMVQSYIFGDYFLKNVEHNKNMTIFFLPCKLEAIGQDFCCTKCHLLSYKKCKCSTKIMCECYN